MAKPNDTWWKQPVLWVEGFVTLNVAFLTFDIYLAHSVNQFRRPAEYIPLLFSALTPCVLVVALSQWRRRWADINNATSTEVFAGSVYPAAASFRQAGFGGVRARSSTKAVIQPPAKLPALCPSSPERSRWLSSRWFGRCGQS